MLVGTKWLDESDCGSFKAGQEEIVFILQMRADTGCDRFQGA
jgi:hypothetical protein